MGSRCLRPIVDDEISDFNYFRGNVFNKAAIGKDGKIKVNTNEVDFETLPNGKIIAKTLPGEIEKIPLDKNDTYLRANFSQSDNRGYRDGDIASSRQYYENVSEDRPRRNMYNAPQNTVTTNEEGELLRNYDKSEYRSTLISDEVRVYKGGSWKDRAFWLDPAQRRFLPQYIATDFIGFRCAMSRIGSKSKIQNKTPKNKRTK